MQCCHSQTYERDQAKNACPCSWITSLTTLPQKSEWQGWMPSSRDGSLTSYGNAVIPELHGKSGENSPITAISVGRLWEHLLYQTLQEKWGKEPSWAFRGFYVKLLNSFNISPVFNVTWTKYLGGFSFAQGCQQKWCIYDWSKGRKSAVVGSQQKSRIPASIEKEKSFKVSFFHHVD